MNNRVIFLAIPIAALAAGIVLMTVMASDSRLATLKQLYSQYILGNTELFQPCTHYPDADVAWTIFSQQGEFQRQVLTLSPGIEVSFERHQAADLGPDQWQCPGKAGVLITVGSTEDRDQVIGRLGHTYAGIPYRVVNR